MNWKYGVVGGLAIITAGLVINQAINSIGFAPDYRAMQAAELACNPHNGVRQLRYAPEGRYRVQCKDGTYIEGVVKQWPTGHTTWRITRWMP